MIDTVVVRIIGKYDQRGLWKLICIVNPFDFLFNNSQKSNLSLNYNNCWLYTDTHWDLHIQASEADMWSNAILVLFIEYYSTYYF